MYQYTFSNEDTEKLSNKTQNYSNMLNNFKEIDTKYSPKDSGSLNLEKMTFEKLSDEQVAKKAEDSLFDYKQKEIDGIDGEYNVKQKNLDEQISTTNNSAKTQKAEANELYSSLKENASNDALKRGLARSSIVINILDAFDKNLIEKYDQIDKEISQKVQSLNNQKALLDEQKQSALNAFDISYAVKLSNKIDEINQKLKAEEQKVIDYNNEIAKKEAEYEANRKKNALDYAEYVNKNGTDTINMLKQNEKFEYAREYLLSLSKEEALEELKNNKVFTSELGPVNHSKLKILVMGQA